MWMNLLQPEVPLNQLEKKVRSTTDQTKLFGTISESIMINQGFIFLSCSIP